jgi:hypothetical protein
VQIYNPAANAWTKAPAYPSDVLTPGCGGIGAKVYCAGGYDSGRGAGTAAAYAYTPQAGTWSPVASMPADLWGGTYAAADGELLISGGITGFDDYLTNEGFAYDPQANAWHELPNAPTALYLGGSACGVYQIGGVDSGGNSYASVGHLPGYTECGGGAGVPWLTASPSRATLAPGQSTTIAVTVSPAAAAVSQPGQYAATLRLDSGAPYASPTVPVTLTATAATTWGQLTGTVSGTDCNGSTEPLQATVQADGQEGDWTLTASPDGQFGLWVDARDRPLTLIVAAGNWIGQVRKVPVSAGKTTTDRFILRRAGCD